MDVTQINKEIIVKVIIIEALGNKLHNFTLVQSTKFHYDVILVHEISCSEHT